MSEESPLPPPFSPTPPPQPPPTSPPAGPFGPAPIYIGPPPDDSARTLALVCHLLGIVTGFLGPLVFWVLKKDENAYVGDQAKEAMNFQIVALIATILCFFGFCLAPFLIAAVQIVRVVFSIIAAVKANQGVAYRYPLTIRFIS